MRWLALPTVFLALSLILVPSPSVACEVFPHVWTIVEHTYLPGKSVSYALADALLQFREKFDRDRTALGMEDGTINFVACVGENPKLPVSRQELEALELAIETVWPATIASFVWQQNLSFDDQQQLALCASRSKANYSVFVQLKELGEENLGLVDEIFFLWASCRVVLKETATVFVKVLDREGKVVFLDEFSVSPTVFADVAITPIGCYLTRLEKSGSRPKALFYACLSEGVHTLVFQDQTVPDSPIPPLSVLIPPDPGVTAFPQPAVIVPQAASQTINQ